MTTEKPSIRRIFFGASNTTTTTLIQSMTLFRLTPCIFPSSCSCIPKYAIHINEACVQAK